MRIAFGSDFHFEFGDFIEAVFSIMDIDVELVVIPGDVGNSDSIIKNLKVIDKITKCPVIYVPGNHEYYGSSFTEMNKIFSTITFDNVSVLNPGEVIIDDILFVGGVGNIDGSYEEISRWKFPQYTDFSAISDFEKRTDLGKYEHNYIFKSLELHKTRKKVVITHTMPSVRCISEKYQGSFLNPCFVNSWDDIIYLQEPDVWFYGHTHEKNEIIIYNTILMCNPHGYRNENPSWNWEYFIL